MIAGTNTAPIFNAMVAWPSEFSQNCQPYHATSPASKPAMHQRQKRLRAAIAISSCAQFFPQRKKQQSDIADRK